FLADRSHMRRTAARSFLDHAYYRLCRLLPRRCRLTGNTHTLGLSLPKPLGIRHHCTLARGLSGEVAWPTLAGRLRDPSVPTSVRDLARRESQEELGCPTDARRLDVTCDDGRCTRAAGTRLVVCRPRPPADPEQGRP